MNWTIILVIAWITAFFRMRKNGHTVYNAFTVSALIALVVTAVLTWAIGHISGAYAAEMCNTLKTVDGRAAWAKEPCQERPIPCSKEWTDEKGSWHSENIPCPPGVKQKTYEQVEREEEAAQQKRCGKDFNSIRIGMHLDRFEECNEGLIFVTETVDSKGRMETWRSTFFIINARGDRITSYTRRTH